VPLWAGPSSVERRDYGAAGPHDFAGHLVGRAEIAGRTAWSPPRDRGGPGAHESSV